MRLYKKWMQIGMTVKAGPYPVATIIAVDLIRCTTTANFWVNGFTVLIEGSDKPKRFIDGAISPPITTLSYERQTFNNVMLTAKRSLNVKFLTSSHFRTLKLCRAITNGFSLSGKIHGHAVSFKFDTPEDLANFPFMTLRAVDYSLEQDAEIYNATKGIQSLIFENFCMKSIDLTTEGNHD